MEAREELRKFRASTKIRRKNSNSRSRTIRNIRESTNITNNNTTIRRTTKNRTRKI